MPFQRPLPLPLVILALILMTGAWLWSQRPAGLPQFPISMTAVGTATPATGGPPSSDPAFFLTNHTARTLHVYLWRVEMRNGDQWTNWSYPDQYITLSPHSGEISAIRFGGNPPTNTWRVQGSAGEALSGAPAILAGLRDTSERWYRRFRTGDTNITLNPAPKGVTHFGNHRLILSEEVPTP